MLTLPQIRQTLQQLGDEFDFSEVDNISTMAAFRLAWATLEKRYGKVKVSDKKREFVKTLTNEQIAYWTRKAVRAEPWLFRFAMANPPDAWGITLAWLTRNGETIAISPNLS